MDSYKQLQAIIDLTPTFISYVGTDFRYRLVSRHYLNYFGRSLEQILGKEMREVIGEIAWKQVAPAMQQALGGRVAHFEAEFPVPGLGMRWSQGTYTPDIDADGIVQGVVIFVKDITDQKLYERALKEQDAFYRSIFESPGICHIEADTQTGRLLRVSRSACELLGYTEAELLDGRTFLDLTHPDDRARNWSLVRPLVEGAVDHFRIEKRYLRKDGSSVWVEVAVTALRDSDGNVCRLLAAIQDITARINAEQELRESEERVRLAVNAAGIGYWTMDPETRSSTMDETCAKLFDLSTIPAEDQVFSRIVPEDRKRVRETFVDSLSRGDAYHAEFRITAADGSQRWLMGLGASMKDSAGKSSLR
jgi:PAS domain S-box-containing protein